MKYKHINKILLALLFFITISMLFAQSELDSLNLEEVIISANKEAQNKSQVAQQFTILTKKNIEKINAASSADLISSQGIHVQKSQQGGGSPVLRGFEASRVLLVVDGVRLNNIIYRAGHLQNIITLDPNMLERVEVAYGPASTIYGSDALGGAIHFFTKTPQLSDGEKTSLLGNAYLRYGSVNNEKTTHLDAQIGFKKLGILLSGTYSQFDDLKSGKNANPFYKNPIGLRPYYAARISNRDTLLVNDDKYLQKFSGYEQLDLLAKVKFQQNNNNIHLLNVQYSNSGDVPRYDRLTDPKGIGLNSSEWYYGPQLRMLGVYTYKYLNHNRKWLQQVTSNLSAQNIEESRHNRNFGSDKLNHRIEKVNVFGWNLDFDNKFTKHDFRFGVDIQYNTLKSTAHQDNIRTLTTVPLDTRYPDGINNLFNGAIYVSHTAKISDRLSINDGIRLGYNKLSSSLNDTTFFKFPFKEINQSTPVYSGNIGLIHHVDQHWRMSLFVNTGFRVPNIDDLSKIFESTPGRIIVPNENLKPEKTITTDFSITKTTPIGLNWETVLYHTMIYDAIIVDQFKYNDQDSIIYNNTLSQVVSPQNKSEAYIYGINTHLKYPLSENMTFNLGFDYTFGRIKTDSTDYPLDHVAPFIGTLGLDYSINKFNANFTTLYNGWKKLTNYNLLGEDNLQYATKDGTPAFIVFNIGTQYTVNRYLKIQLGVNNILDTQYRTFASGINGAGRNVYATLRISY